MTDAPAPTAEDHAAEIVEAIARKVASGVKSRLDGEGWANVYAIWESLIASAITQAVAASYERAAITASEESIHPLADQIAAAIRSLKPKGSHDT